MNDVFQTIGRDKIRFFELLPEYKNLSLSDQLWLIGEALAKSNTENVELYATELLKHYSGETLPSHIFNSCFKARATDALRIALKFYSAKNWSIWIDAIERECDECIRVILDTNIEFDRGTYPELFEKGSSEILNMILYRYPNIPIEITSDAQLDIPFFIRKLEQNRRLSEDEREFQINQFREIVKPKRLLFEKLFSTISFSEFDVINFIHTNEDRIPSDFYRMLYRYATQNKKYSRTADFLASISPDFGWNLTQKFNTGYYRAEFTKQEQYVLSLPEKEQEILHLYTRGAYDTENKQLFKQPEKPCTSLNCDSIAKIQRIISHAPPITREFIVYRGGLEGYDSFPGRMIVSTSTSEKVMELFADNKYGYELTVKKGCRALPLYVLSHHPKEYEFLFDREMVEFEYENARKKGQLTIFEMDIVPKERE